MTTTDNLAQAVAEANQQMAEAKERYEAEIASITATLNARLSATTDTQARDEEPHPLVREWLDGEWKHPRHFANSVAKREEIATCPDAPLWHAHACLAPHSYDRPAPSCVARRRDIAESVLTVLELAGYDIDN